MRIALAFCLTCLIAVTVTFAQAPVNLDPPPIKTEPDPPKPASVTEEQRLRAQVLLLQQQVADLRKQGMTMQANWLACQDKADAASREATWQQLSKDAGCVVNRSTLQCEPSKP